MPMLTTSQLTNRNPNQRSTTMPQHIAIPPKDETRRFKVTIPARRRSPPPHSFTAIALRAALPTLVNYLGLATLLGLVLLAVCGASPAEVARSYVDADQQARTSVDIAIALYAACFAACATVSLATYARRERWTRYHEILDVGYSVELDRERRATLRVHRLAPYHRSDPPYTSKLVASIDITDDRHADARAVDRAIHGDLTRLKSDLSRTTTDIDLPATTEQVLTATGATI